MFASYAKIRFPAIDYWRAVFACRAKRGYFLTGDLQERYSVHSPRKRRNVSHILGLSCDSGQTGPKRRQRFASRFKLASLDASEIPRGGERHTVSVVFQFGCSHLGMSAHRLRIFVWTCDSLRKQSLVCKVCDLLPYMR